MGTPGLSVWVVDDDESVRWVLEQALKQANMAPRCFSSGEAFFSALALEKPDVLVTDIRMPGMTGLELMERLAEIEPEIPVIVITAHSDLDSAVSAYRVLTEAVRYRRCRGARIARGTSTQPGIDGRRAAASAAYDRAGAGNAGSVSRDR